MFTQCANCETVFRLSAEVLRTAGGQVRCGRCGEVFNALARLAEDASGFSVGESALEMETLADQILESTVLPAAIEAADGAPPRGASETPGALSGAAGAEELSAADAEFAQLQVIDVSTDSLFEFTLPPGELDRVFVEPKMKPIPPIARDKVAAAPAAQEPAPATAHRMGIEVSEEARRGVLAGFEEAQLPPIAAARREWPRAAWMIGAVALALALLAQIALTHREWLARTLGAAATPSAASLSAYELRQWGVTGDPGARGTLRVRASILNTTSQLQPYPLLRLTLANRFGNRIGTRDFEPAEYMGKPMVRMLAPAERADATLDILDPGKDAEGFEIDVCLRAADKKITCAADVAPQRKP